MNRRGRWKWIQNLNGKFGAEPQYAFVKVQAANAGEVGEEYWLLTPNEVQVFTTRAQKLKALGMSLIERWDVTGRVLGEFQRVQNDTPLFGSNQSYFVLWTREGLTRPAPSTPLAYAWAITDGDLQRIQDRVAENQEDIAANREGWLADILD